MNIKLKSHSLLLALCLLIFSFVMLSINNVKADVGPGIAIAPDYPKEQVQKNGIFDVQFKQNQHYNLTIKIANLSNENKSITISPNTAYTSNSGNIAFDKSNIPNDSYRKYDFHSLFNQKKKKVTIPAKSISKVNFGLKMPTNEYRGIILGGFYISIPNNSKSDTKSTFKIRNTYSYSLATVIHNSKGKANSKIKLGKIIPNNNNNQMQVNSNIKNISASIISGMNVKSEIINSNNKIVSKSNHNNLSMAPNSSFNYKDTIENSLSPGNYKVKLNIKDDNGHTWQESKNFKINTREYISHFTKRIPWMLYILIGIIVLLILIVIFLLYRQFKNKNNNKAKNNSKKKK